MNKFSDILRRLGANISRGFRHFMMGRYGTDKLNIAILGTGLVLCLVVAIGIPVLSPAVVLLGLSGVDALLKLSPVLTGILIILGALAAIFLLAK